MRILVADDDPVTLEAVCAMLRLDGHEPVPAANGREALRVWESGRPDLVCLDIMMPEVDGYEVCRRIRAQDAGVPILFLSAKQEEIDIVLGLGLGADDFIRKPFGRHELLARVRAATRRTLAVPTAQAGERPKAFEFGPARVIPDELRAELRDRSVELTPREVAMLQLLWENKGRPVHRDTFLDRCWGVEYFPESRTLDQHIATLRRKIEATPAEPVLIETVRGVGYRYRGLDPHQKT